MEWINKIAQICSNTGYATIIAAIIAAVAAVGIAIYNKRKKGGDEGEVVVVPPPTDPLSKLNADAAGIKEIDQIKFGTHKYAEILATRMELLKNPDSEVDVFIEEEGEHD